MLSFTSVISTESTPSSRQPPYVTGSFWGCGNVKKPKTKCKFLASVAESVETLSCRYRLTWEYRWIQCMTTTHLTTKNNFKSGCWVPKCTHKYLHTMGIMSMIEIIINGSRPPTKQTIACRFMQYSSDTIYCCCKLFCWYSLSFPVFYQIGI